MKAKLEFDLDDVDDQNAHIRCVSATDAYLVLNDISENLRRHNKNGATLIPEIMIKEFYELMDRHNVSLDHLQ